MTGVCAPQAEFLADCIAVVSGIGQAQPGCHLANQFQRRWGIAAMAGTDDQLPGAALFVDSGMDFRRARAT